MLLDARRRGHDDYSGLPYSLPVKSVKELIALAKARPGDLNFGAGPAGGGPHLAAEAFKSMAGINIVYVRYKGAGPALNALLSGEVQMMLFTPVSVMPFLKSGTEIVAGSPIELAATMKADMARWGKVIKDADIKAE